MSVYFGHNIEKGAKGGEGFVLKISTLVSCPNIFENDCSEQYKVYLLDIISRSIYW